MKKQSTSRFAFFNPRALVRFVLCLGGVLLASAEWTEALAQPPSAPAHLRMSSSQFPEATANANTTFTYKIIDAPNHTYGYEVFGDGTLMIHQTSMPRLTGNEGFKTKQDASKIALLVIEKIRKGEMPPTISIDELKTLGVIR
jgi:hypothetical protein